MIQLSSLVDDLTSSDFGPRQLREIVPIEKWIESPYYVGEDGVRLYDYWKQELINFENSGHPEWIITGCFVGSTQIALLSGGSKSLLDLSKEYPDGGGDFGVYSVNSHGNIVPGRARNVRKTGEMKRVFKVTFDNGKAEYCTGDHLFLLRNNEYRKAESLVPGDSLMPLYRTYDKTSDLSDRSLDGYERVYDPALERWICTHRVVGHHSLGLPLFGGIGNCQVIHHKNGKLDNSPESLEVMGRSEHINLHRSQNHLLWEIDSYREAQAKGRAIAKLQGKYKLPTVCREALSAYQSTAKGKERALKNLLSIDNSDPRIIESRRRVGSSNMIALWSDTEFVKQHSDRLIERNKDSSFVLKMRDLKRSTRKVSVEEILDALRTSSSVSEASRSLGISNNSVCRWLGEKGHPSTSAGLRKAGYLNHKVVSVAFSHLEDVYDMEVDDYHNFALESGVFVHNSLGAGKTTVACFAALRRIYILSCYDPIPYLFDLMRSTRLYFMYFSVSMKQAPRTGFGRLITIYDEIPFFKKIYTRNKNITAEIRCRNLSVLYGSDVSHQIGLDMIGSILDEGDFFKVKTSRSVEEYSKARDIYSSTATRRKIRFSVGGKDQGLSILISSASYSTDLVEDRIEKSKKSGGTYVTEVSGYKIVRSKYGEGEFPVYPGSVEQEPRLISEKEPLLDLMESFGYPSEDLVRLDHKDMIKEFALRHEVVYVPMVFKEQFEEDIIKATQEIIGRSIKKVSEFLTRVQVASCFSSCLKHPFKKTVVSISTKNSLRIEDFLLPDRLVFDKSIPRAVHIDQSITSDRTGMACSFFDPENEDLAVVEWMLAITPPSVGEIPIIRCAEFISHLIDLGYNIVRVTMDSYQSRASLQYFEEQDIDSELLSVDRNDEAYVEMREMILSGRLRYYDHPIYKKEVRNLVWDRSRRKVDHPKNGSKDMTDAVAGSLVGARIVFGLGSCPYIGMGQRK